MREPASNPEHNCIRHVVAWSLFVLLVLFGRIAGPALITIVQIIATVLVGFGCYFVADWAIYFARTKDREHP